MYFFKGPMNSVTGTAINGGSLYLNISINNDFLFYFPVNKDDQDLPKRSNSPLAFTPLPHSRAQLCVDTYSKRRWAGEGAGLPAHKVGPEGTTLGPESNAFESSVTSGSLIFIGGQMADNFTKRNCSMLIGVTLVLCPILTTSARLVLGLLPGSLM